MCHWAWLEPFTNGLEFLKETPRNRFAAVNLISSYLGEHSALHAGFASSTHSRAAYGCDFMLDADLKPLLLEVTFAPAPLWSSESMPARVDGVADDIFRTLFFGETARVTRC